jgi:hypothetical protein
MKRSRLKEMTDAQLVDRFAEIALRQDEALLGDEFAVFNRLYDLMDEVTDELKSRPGDQRSRLVGLYDHPNGQVRLKAAVRTLAVAPMTARGVLEAIVTSRKFPQAGDAGMLLAGLDDGTFKPT